MFHCKYVCVLFRGGGEEGDALSDRMSGGGSEGFSDLIAAVRRRQFKKRRLQALRFSLATDPMAGQVGLAGENCVHLHVYQWVCMCVCVCGVQGRT